MHLKEKITTVKPRVKNISKTLKHINDALRQCDSTYYTMSFFDAKTQFDIKEFLVRKVEDGEDKKIKCIYSICNLNGIF